MQGQGWEGESLHLYCSAVSLDPSCPWHAVKETPNLDGLCCVPITLMACRGSDRVKIMLVIKLMACSLMGNSWRLPFSSVGSILLRGMLCRDVDGGSQAEEVHTAPSQNFLLVRGSITFAFFDAVL